MIVLVPAYEPDGRLLDLLRSLGHRRVVVVDDGSGPAYAAVFAAARERGALVLTLPTNRGKGHALKVGFAHVAEAFAGEPVVCADSDGQHTPADIDLIDTQTGLRGYPARMLPWLVSEGGDRFEYELRLLLRRWVFSRGGKLAPRRSSALRYAALAGVVLVANIVLLEAMWTATGSLVVSKVATELALFVTSFVAQRHVVFARRRSATRVDVEPPVQLAAEVLNR